MKKWGSKEYFDYAAYERKGAAQEEARGDYNQAAGSRKAADAAEQRGAWLKVRGK